MNGNARDKSLAEIANDIKAELKVFFETRMQMLSSEIKEKIRVVKISAPMLAVAALFAFMAFVLLTFCLVALIATAIGGLWGTTLALLFIGALYAMVGGTLGWLGYREIQASGIVPQRTIQVLKQDGVWIQSEARSQV